MPIPATLGWRSRASNNVTLTFRHQSRSSDSVRWSCSESSHGRAQPHSAFVRTMRSPRALQYIELFHVLRYSVISTPPFVSLRFTCPDLPACVPTAPDHSGCHALAPSTLSRAEHHTPWPNAMHMTAFIALFHWTPWTLQDAPTS